MRARPLILVVVGVVILAALWFAFAGRRAAAPPPAPPQPAAIELAPEDIATVVAGDIDNTLALTGTLGAIQQTTLTAQIEGKIASVEVRPGAAVTQGQVLARFDTANQQRQVAVAQAQLEKSRELLEYNRKLAKRNADLLAQNFISKNAFDNTQSQLQTAQADERAAVAQLGVAQQAVDNGTVRAPFTGTLAQRLVEPGQHVGVNSQLFTLVDLTELELAAAVPSTRIADVHVGQNVDFNVEGYRRAFSGTIIRINPTVDENSKTVSIYIRVPNPDGELRSGLFAQGTVLVDRRKGVSTLPLAAVHGDGSNAYVLTIESDRLVRRAVQVGATDLRRGQAELVSGPALGSKVLASNIALTAGTAVKLPTQGK
ncbi:MexH family multidrug efflux RND transporter periplasmic adaptor subunit [Chitiniphilus shinanonensis]|uniref:MexH family multidrug efflux RND transporter periplasmic adaptor subunit n=1 Tax=Chitiniphilus shinanonensis TaxID=553088 RepID=A0ABQ6BTL9_9NEIS|nr:efflux RND transporter periplasmic adaptor subunit [Chitiniphilus shinanonensis]GLS03881.1 MexH family multidrug efflux RND transporter periplasmic adaptor subunit [Chitiniphilus shinanonensis]